MVKGTVLNLVVILVAQFLRKSGSGKRLIKVMKQDAGIGKAARTTKAMGSLVALTELRFCLIGSAIN